MIKEVNETSFFLLSFYGAKKKTISQKIPEFSDMRGELNISAEKLLRRHSLLYIWLSLGKLHLVSLLQVVKRTNTPPIP